MEIYKITATCANDATIHEIVYLPENFEGIKITQKFNWINPVGYTAKFSLETMRVILGDKTWLDNIFDTYIFQSDVTLAIYKLNATATAYEFKSNFKIDFESYTKLGVYSEFALKSVSCIDFYNEIKGAATNFDGVTNINTPATQLFINYISLKNNSGLFHGNNTAEIALEENNTSKVYNGDMAIYNDVCEAYQFYRGGDGAADIVLSATGDLTTFFDWSGGTLTLAVKIYRNTFDDPILELGRKTVNYGTSAVIPIDLKKTKLSDFAFTEYDFLFVGIEASSVSCTLTNILGNFSLELYVKTELPANEFVRRVPYLTSETIINQIFDNQATIEEGLKSVGVSSAQTILKRLNYISLIPKDFLNDFCLANGAMVNFKIDGTVDIAKISTFFSTLLDKSNAILIEDFKDLEISADSSLNFAGVSVGMEQKDYEVYTYFNDWNKILTFKQAGRNASEILNIALAKYRVDFSGILDFLNKLSSSTTQTASDMFLFNQAFTGRSTTEGYVYDLCTPRDILENWRTFLSFIFYNFGKDTLEFSSNDGDEFNLQIAGVNQFDDFVFSGTDPKILPVQVSFTCLLSDVDFTENILKLTNGDEEMFIFVTEAETTDKLSEQKIKGNLIYFAS